MTAKAFQAEYQIPGSQVEGSFRSVLSAPNIPCNRVGLILILWEPIYYSLLLYELQTLGTVFICKILPSNGTKIAGISS